MDVSGNNVSVEDTEEVENVEALKGTREEDSRGDYEAIVSDSIDYSYYLEDLHNDITFNNALLLAFLLLFGLLKGLKKL